MIRWTNFALGFVFCLFVVGSFNCKGCDGGVLPKGGVWAVCR